METSVEMAGIPTQFTQPDTMVMEVSAPSSQNPIQTQLVSENSMSAVTQQNSAILGALTNSQHGQVVFTTAQTQASIPVQNLQSVVKRPLFTSSGTSPSSHIVTKVIITKNPNNSQPQAVPTLTAGSHAQSILLPSSSSHTQSLGSLTPTKTVTISQGGLLSPTKLLSTTLPTTPTKQVIPVGSKFAISPLKTPPKITMIPISGKSPQRIVPASGQLMTMIAKSVMQATSGSSTITTATAKPATITLSPSKVIFKQQPGVQTIAKGSLVAQQLNTAPQPSGAGPFATVAGMQPLSVSGSKFQYVRLVTAPSSQISQNVHITKPATIAPAPLQAKPIAPAQTSTVGPPQMKITMPLTQQQVLAKASGAMIQPQQPQRILLPATSQVGTRLSGGTTGSLATIQPSGNSLSGLPPGTTIISSGQNMSGVQGFALVPAQYVQQIQQINPQPQPQATQRAHDGNFVAITSNNVPSTSRHGINGSLPSEPAGQRPRKPCNCTKSQCLKLYCDCFANGEFCHNCNCSNCANNLEHEDERSRAIKACLDRNPLAFHPKIGKGKHGEGDRRHNKGCNCKRSGCLKNYCECYEAKILCSSTCKCVGCKNFEESPDRKTLMHLADAAEVRVQQQTAAKTKLSSQIQDVPPRPQPPISGERLPYTFVTNEVADATCACLVAQAEEAERTRQMEIIQERLLLEEFGRCLMQVIESASKTKAPSPVP